MEELDLEGRARSTDPHTSHESAEESGPTRKHIAEHIVAIALRRGNGGLTISEATDALPQFKPVSVSPIFAPLVKQGKLVRRIIGTTAKGKPKYETRFDPRSERNVIVHFHPAVERKQPVKIDSAPPVVSVERAVQ